MIELLIAMSVAGVIGTSIYFVYQGQTRVFFAQETIAQTQAELRFAMETIKADVKRAGYLATISTQSTNFWCGAKPNPAITAISATQGDGFVFNPTENLNIAPDSLRLLGAFSANNTLYSSGTLGNVITLSNDPVYSPGFPATQVDYDRIFASGSLLRILDSSNRYQLQRITGSSYLSRSVTLQAISSSSVQGCGPTGIGQGLLVNPVEYIRYRIIDTSNSTNPAACGNSPALVGRTTLVRESLAPDGTTVLATLPIADYVVDFRVSFTSDTAASGQQPSIADDLNPYDFVGNATVAAVTANPQQVRSVGIYIAARTAQEDPSFSFRQRQAVGTAAGAGLGPLLSFNLDAERLGSCRVRTVSSEVQLRNFSLQGL